MSIQKTEKRYHNLSGQKIPISSRLNVFNLLINTSNNVYFINIFRNYEIIKIVKNNNVYFDIYYAEENDWWDNISYKYYDTERLWWLVCEMNDIVNPFEDIEFGQQIKVLKMDYLYNIFSSLLEISRL